ncbi:MAG: hypothetical protein AAFX58_09330, partial [Pseudomonadota bacterium]
LTCDLRVVQTIQRALRDGQWKVTVAVREGERLLNVWPGFRDKAYGLAVLPIDRPTVTRNASLVYSDARPMTPAGQRLLAAVREAAADFDAGGRLAVRNNTPDAAV